MSLVFDFAAIGRSVNKSREGDVRDLFSHIAAADVVPCGSRHVCDPPVTTTDEDYLIYIPGSYIGVDSFLRAHGYVNESEMVSLAPADPNVAAPRGSGAVKANGTPGTEFSSWRDDTVNLIVTQDRGFFNKFKLATQVTKKLNVLHKEDRIRLYTAIVYGEYKE